MRYALMILTICAPVVASAADKPAHKSMPACMDGEQYSRLAERLQKHPPDITPARLPAGMHIGRCLFEVKGRRLIDGKCAYSIQKDGSFEIDGPRQIYGGIDYPNCFQGAATFTTDYFVQVDWIGDKEMGDGSRGPGWEARWNGQIGSNHAEEFIGPVTRHGACYTSARSWAPKTKICLWRK